MNAASWSGPVPPVPPAAVEWSGLGVVLELHPLGQRTAFLGAFVERTSPRAWLDAARADARRDALLRDMWLRHCDKIRPRLRAGKVTFAELDHLLAVGTVIGVDESILRNQEDLIHASFDGVAS